MTEEKTFQHFLELPGELRTMFIDKMEPADRCRFSGCSKLSKKEAENSKNYINTLNISVVDAVEISIAHNDSPSSIDYLMRFEKNQLDGNHINCLDKHGQFLWRTKLDTSTDITLYGVLIFKKLLQKYQHSVKILAITGNFTNFDFEIHNLSRLEQLTLNGYADIQQFLSKMRHPLKTLRIPDLYNLTEITEHITRVSEELSLPKTLDLDDEEFLQLSAANVVMSIGYLTEIDIFNFIKSWQNGTLGKRLERYAWRLKGSNFDIRELVELLDAPGHDLGKENLQIQHLREVGKTGKLLLHFFQGASTKAALEFREETNQEVGFVDNNMN